MIGTLKSFNRKYINPGCLYNIYISKDKILTIAERTSFLTMSIPYEDYDDYILIKNLRCKERGTSYWASQTRKPMMKSNPEEEDDCSEITFYTNTLDEKEITLHMQNFKKSWHIRYSV